MHRGEATGGGGRVAAALGGRAQAAANGVQNEYFKWKKLIFILTEFGIIKPTKSKFNK
jgi:hypothetical protein